mgnify:CR=1 FL=1
MSDQLRRARDLYGPQCHKTFEGALGAFISEECPQLGGHLTRKALVQAIAQLVTAHFPASSHTAQGQMRWTAVHKDEKSSYGKTIGRSRLTPVVLDLLPYGEGPAPSLTFAHAGSRPGRKALTRARSKRTPSPASSPRPTNRTAF